LNTVRRSQHVTANLANKSPARFIDDLVTPFFFKHTRNF
jgi:hypothetical protein